MVVLDFSQHYLMFLRIKIGFLRFKNLSCFYGCITMIKDRHYEMRSTQKLDRKGA